MEAEGKITIRVIESVDEPYLAITKELVINIYLYEHDSGKWSGNDMDTDLVVENKSRREMIGEIVFERIMKDPG